MTAALEAAPPRAGALRVALLGNPNTGKTTLFNVLTGFRAKTGNYAGVTVERRTGRLKCVDKSSAPVDLVDLPGTYSLAAQSPDERLAVDVLLGLQPDEQPIDALLVVLDATNLRRNLLLASQAVELGLPTIFALNMSDAAEKQGIRLKAALLAERLGAPVVATVASSGVGADEICEALSHAEGLPAPRALAWQPDALHGALAELRSALEAASAPAPFLTTLFLQRALLDRDGECERMVARDAAGALPRLKELRKKLHDSGFPLPTLEARGRYAAIDKLLDGVVATTGTLKPSMTDRLDKVLLHPVLGLVVFAALMIVVFQAIYAWSGPFMDLIEGVFGAAGGYVGGFMAEGPLQSLLVDGVVAGVGGVLVFLPQILILFFFLGLLEDCGYMARAAFVMDRWLGGLGLSGRSFIPLLSSFACAIPGVMATRTIADPRERMKTLLLAPLMSCSARLPVYVLFIGAFVPEHDIVPGLVGLQGLVLFLMYGVGAGAAIVIALVLRAIDGRRRKSSLIMELPPYRKPQWRTVILRLWDRGMAFIKTAGTMILAVSILVWAAAYFPRPAAIAEEIEAAHAVEIAQAQATLSGEALEEAVASIEAERDNEIAGAYLRQSILGRMGHFIEPVVRPIGWDWKIAMAVVASFPAREVVVATLGVIYDVGEADEESGDLRSRLQAATWPDGSPVFTLPVALSIMVFFALCAQCAATLAVIKRETNSWKWPALSFAYMTALAYVGALLVYHIGTALLGG